MHHWFASSGIQTHAHSCAQHHTAHKHTHTQTDTHTLYQYPQQMDNESRILLRLLPVDDILMLHSHFSAIDRFRTIMQLFTGDGQPIKKKSTKKGRNSFICTQISDRKPQAGNFYWFICVQNCRWMVRFRCNYLIRTQIVGYTLHVVLSALHSLEKKNKLIFSFLHYWSFGCDERGIDGNDDVPGQKYFFVWNPIKLHGFQIQGRVTIFVWSWQQ